jgi:hypothetical protein
MGIRLDWEIEAEQEHRQQSGGEDPETRRKRRRARLRFLLVLFVMLALIGGVVSAVVLRLRQVDWQMEQLLRDTVSAEVAALRLGDHVAYLDMQRSATNDWLQRQDANFARYQTLKQTHNLNLSGRIINSTVDGQRGRVQIEEIIDGVPFGRMWFYWRYDDGWRHVPPDYTFWGDAKTVEASGVQVSYHAVDEAIAQAIAPEMSDWLKIGCAALNCASSPQLNVEIVPTEGTNMSWSPNDLWAMEIPSPLIDSMRLDQPFDIGMKIKAANLLAERLVGNFSPAYPSDAYYLRQAVVSWLVKRFAQVETNSFLISSLADKYGDPAVGQLWGVLQPDSNVGVISQVTGTALDLSYLDWRDFLTWRLTVENELIARQDEADFLALYNTSDDYVRGQAYVRYAAGASSKPHTVISAISERDTNNTPQLRAVVQVGDPANRQEEVIFRLIDGVWKRAS